MLIRIIKNWDSPDLLRQTPLGKGLWGSCQFTLEEIPDCDFVIVLNYLNKDVTVNCPPENVWAIMQEPYIKGPFDWMVYGHDQFPKVFTHHLPSSKTSKKYVLSQPALPWHVNKTYDELKAMEPFPKLKNLSWITSNLQIFPGHKKRMSFFEQIKNSDLQIDLFGKGINFIEDKWNGMADYKYSLAIENSSGHYYWTEKIADCFLAYSLPIYYGCTNLEDFFPKESFIRIDIDQPEEAIEIIKRSIEDNEYEKRLPYIIEARNKILEEYQFFPFISKLISSTNVLSKKNILLKKYKAPPKEQPSLLWKVRSILGKIIRQFQFY